jgi:hypothetical protein
MSATYPKSSASAFGADVPADRLRELVEAASVDRDIR